MQNATFPFVIQTMRFICNRADTSRMVISRKATAMFDLSRGQIDSLTLINCLNPTGAKRAWSLTALGGPFKKERNEPKESQRVILRITLSRYVSHKGREKIQWLPTSTCFIESNEWL